MFVKDFVEVICKTNFNPVSRIPHCNFATLVEKRNILCKKDKSAQKDNKNSISYESVQRDEKT
jgi:hypothetical protein